MAWRAAIHSKLRFYGRGPYDFLSFSSSSFFTADLKFLIPSPTPFPKSASLLGPKSRSAIARISRISVNPNLPPIVRPSLRGLPGSQRKTLKKVRQHPCAKSRPPYLWSQRNVRFSCAGGLGLLSPKD